MAEKNRQLARSNPFDLEEWDPFQLLPFRGLRSRLTEELLGNGGGLSRPLAPAIDVTESDRSYDISIEVPGAKKDDLVVECKDGVLSLRGEKRSERDEKRDSARVLERTYGAFSRSLTLPSDADPGKISASYKDGVLHIAVEKRPETKATAVAIKG